MVLWRGKSPRAGGRGKGTGVIGEGKDHLVPCWHGTCRGKPRSGATQHCRGDRAAPGDTEVGCRRPEGPGLEGRKWSSRTDSGRNLFLLPTRIASRAILAVRRGHMFWGDGVCQNSSPDWQAIFIFILWLSETRGSYQCLIDGAPPRWWFRLLGRLQWSRTTVGGLQALGQHNQPRGPKSWRSIIPLSAHGVMCRGWLLLKNTQHSFLPWLAHVHSQEAEAVQLSDRRSRGIQRIDGRWTSLWLFSSWAEEAGVLDPLLICAKTSQAAKLRPEEPLDIGHCIGHWGSGTTTPKCPMQVSGFSIPRDYFHLWSGTGMDGSMS